MKRSTPHRLALTALMLGLTAAAVPGAALAADSEPSPPAATDPLAAARSQIAKKQWPAAIDALKRVNANASADWNNLMGYSLRKRQPPDLAGAETHYDSALRIDPKHRGALEYSGELYLMTGRLELAEARLAALEKACVARCEEYADLKKAVEGYKAAGNRYVAQP